MVLPQSLLRSAQNHPMLIELKNGETYNGHLATCDSWMNIHLKDAICTSKDGDKFVKYPEVLIRGSTVKYIRIPEEVVDLVRKEAEEARKQQKDNKKFKKQWNSRGGHSQRGGIQKGGGNQRNNRGGRGNFQNRN
ncbi:U6 snRNA-associated Sm-like protein LSm4 [Strongyloides ratti]|uniref:U6 snRNA-associated Sm-like protein LSm4 n=1 Tax=Strongyloides ratti TaxID=34506 RepID=A0A090LG17_STRRB|nr:U6 snRNA-associated Sm-like protein LSm4 [Strongyloides ratti]CEF66465.1 U6 snRNA-associated Sm-like protein LSm4 [Strongyloides ratti]